MGLEHSPTAPLEIPDSLSTRMEDLMLRLDREMTLSVAQGVADIAGLFDPTPTSDIIGGVLSLAAGDFLGAGLSVVSMVPYVGDALGKPIKLTKHFKTIQKMQDRLKSLKAMFKHTQHAMDPKTAARIKKIMARLDAQNLKWDTTVETYLERIKGLFKRNNKEMLGRAEQRVLDKNIEGCKPKYRKKTIPDEKKRAGAHRDTKKPENRADGGTSESNHTPADASNPRVPKNDGGAVQMDPGDHVRASTTGNSREAVLSRDLQSTMTDQGYLRTGVEMDKTDAHLKFGDRYDDLYDEVKDNYWTDARLQEF